MIITNKKFLLLLALSISIPPSFAQVHKWKDAEGKIHYGDIPKVRSEATSIKVDRQSEDHKANADMLRRQTARVMNDVAIENAKGEQNKRQLNAEYQRQAVQERRNQDQPAQRVGQRR